GFPPSASHSPYHRVISAVCSLGPLCLHLFLPPPTPLLLLTAGHVQSDNFSLCSGLFQIPLTKGLLFQVSVLLSVGKQSCHHSNYHVSSPSDKPRMSRNLPGFHVMLSAIPFVNNGLSCSTAEHQGAERGCVTCHKSQKNRNKNKQDRIKPPRLYQRGQNEALTVMYQIYCTCM
uniref:Uncharacterized protein n=1 Tax=Mus spicilegus TaxID=10103 RepID=A0A8C6GPK0_MUSSI